MKYLIVNIIPTTPPPAKPARKNDPLNRKLTALYSKDGKQYPIECFYSPCRTKCHFSNPDLGEAIFDQKTETFIASTRFIDAQYINYLTRTIRQWKKQFPNFK